MKKPMANHL